jgi:hypothetical protein
MMRGDDACSATSLQYPLIGKIVSFSLLDEAATKGIIKAVFLTLLPLLWPATVLLWRALIKRLPPVPEHPDEWNSGKWNDVCAWVWEHYGPNRYSSLDDAIEGYASYLEIVRIRESLQNHPRIPTKGSSNPNAALPELPTAKQLKEALARRGIVPECHPPPGDIASYRIKRRCVMSLFVGSVVVAIGSIILAAGLVFGFFTGL